jgi:hypothetical protein
MLIELTREISRLLSLQRNRLDSEAGYKDPDLSTTKGRNPS